MLRRKAKSYNTAWDISGRTFPVKIYYEWRNSRRVSLGKKTIIVRLPWASKLNHEDNEKWAKNWLTSQHSKHPEAFEHYNTKGYTDGDVIQTTRKTYHLSIIPEVRKTGYATCKENRIIAKIPHGISHEQESKMIHTLIGRILAQDNKLWVTERVSWLNQHYIQKPINSVSLKNNRSNWGSCSSGGNINISVRLLFAPEDVQDYVLIHELAHLKEMNHTSRFWKIVEDIMPDYKQKEKWLKKNNHLCNF